jgi:hypothetical protein
MLRAKMVGRPSLGTAFRRRPEYFDLAESDEIGAKRLGALAEDLVPLGYGPPVEKLGFLTCHSEASAGKYPSRNVRESREIIPPGERSGNRRADAAVAIVLTRLEGARAAL